MKITFSVIARLYLVILMFVSLLCITDRLFEQTSRPIIITDNIDPVVVVLKKGPVFPQRLQKF